MDYQKGEAYHVFNRGVDKRKIFNDKNDVKRFLQSMKEFNCIDPIGSIHENSFSGDKKKQKTLVSYVAYCLNPNHFHLLLIANTDNGISKLMQRLGNGYTKYFNERNKRLGSLFQGRYKKVFIPDDDVSRLSAYVNLNYKIHQLGHSMSKLVVSSWEEYLGGIEDEKQICTKDVVLKHFKNRESYRRFSENTVKEIVELRRDKKEIEENMLE